MYHFNIFHPFHKAGSILLAIPEKMLHFIVNLKGHAQLCREILGGGWLDFLYF